MAKSSLYIQKTMLTCDDMSRFGLIISDKNLQDSWIKRIVSAVIDGIIIGIIALIIISVFFYGWGFWFGSLIFGVLWLLYFALMEGTRGTTIGKKMMHSKVVSTSGNMDVSKGFIRNISKIYWVVLLIDIVVGLATEGDPRQRFLDRYANTVVLREGENIQYMPLSAPVQPTYQPAQQTYQPPYISPDTYAANIKVYTKALEWAWRDGIKTRQEDETLEVMRDGLHITAEDHKKLEMEVKKRIPWTESDLEEIKEAGKHSSSKLTVEEFIKISGAVRPQVIAKEYFEGGKTDMREAVVQRSTIGAEKKEEGFKICPHCGEPLKKGLKVCPSCGETV